MIRTCHSSKESLEITSTVPLNNNILCKSKIYRVLSRVTLVIHLNERGRCQDVLGWIGSPGLDTGVEDWILD